MLRCWPDNHDGDNDGTKFIHPIHLAIRILLQTADSHVKNEKKNFGKPQAEVDLACVYNL